MNRFPLYAVMLALALPASAAQAPKAGAPGGAAAQTPQAQEAEGGAQAEVRVPLVSDKEGAEALGEKEIGEVILPPSDSMAEAVPSKPAGKGGKKGKEGGKKMRTKNLEKYDKVALKKGLLKKDWKEKCDKAKAGAAKVDEGKVKKMAASYAFWKSAKKEFSKKLAEGGEAAEKSALKEHYGEVKKKLKNAAESAQKINQSVAKEGEAQKDLEGPVFSIDPEDLKE